MPHSLSRKMVRFGPFELDLTTADLSRAGRKVRLPEQQFRVLEMLLRSKGELVSREDIRKRLWPNDTIVEFDTSINTTIKKLRAALADSASQPQFIETVSRRGYRIMIEVHFLSSAVKWTRGPRPKPSAKPFKNLRKPKTIKRTYHFDAVLFESFENDCAMQLSTPKRILEALVRQWLDANSVERTAIAERLVRWNGTPDYAED